jgi:hypothetical protein
MCGRFVSTSTADAIASYFGATTSIESLGQNFNVAPTHDIYGVVADPAGNKSVQAFHWGLIPSWAKERKIGAKMINARSETITEKPSFRGLVKNKRVIIPMVGVPTEGGATTGLGACRVGLRGYERYERCPRGLHKHLPRHLPRHLSRSFSVSPCDSVS